MDQTLYKNIANSSAHRPSRDRNAASIFSNPSLLPDLMAIAMNTSDRNHHKACWVLELVFEQHIIWLKPYLASFCRTLPSFSHDGAIRSISKICLFSAHCHLKSVQKKEESFLSSEQLNQVTEACFDWLISDRKVASKAYAMRTLFELGHLQDWVHPELKTVLEQGYAGHSGAYKAACRDVLQKIAKSRGQSGISN